MKLPKLKKRLLTISNLVEENKSVVDVGCDHGYLAAHIALTKKPKSVIASDVHQLPLNRAMKTMGLFSVGHLVQLRLSNGLKNILEDEAEVVIIAGMGGELIAQIIDEFRYNTNKKTTYFLQPMTTQYELRAYLLTRGYDIIDEIAVEENTKIYSVMVVRFTDNNRRYPDYYFHVGKLLYKKDKISQLYLDKIEDKLREKIYGIRLAKQVMKVDMLEDDLVDIKRERSKVNGSF